MKILRSLCALLLCAAVVLPAGALAAVEDSGKYPDLSPSHWAYTEMDQAVQLGILNGMGNGRLAPEDTLTWGQYLVMLERAIYPELYADAASYFAWDVAGYHAARETGLLLEGDFLPVTEDTLSQPILRQDAAVLLSRLLPDLNYSYLWETPDGAEVPAPESVFTDWAGIPQTHRPAVERLFQAVVVKGRTDGSFDGQATIKRADGTVLLMRALPLAEMTLWGEPKTITLRILDQDGGLLVEDRVIDAALGDETSMLAEVEGPPQYAFADGYAVVTRAVDFYTVTMRPFTQAELEQEQYYDQLTAGKISNADYDSQDFHLRTLGENSAKRTLLYGNPTQRRYPNRQTAEQHMTTITVPMWKLDSSGNKYATERQLRIHEAIANDVVAIFTEIFNDPEQFPIKELGGYGWRGDKATGEHNCGTAIDINWNENYQIRNGRVETGSLWAPGSNPYSIAPGSSVVHIFREHGWSWGGSDWAGHSDASKGYHDYMHFSYMGW